MRTITTYDRFDRHIAAWAAGEIEALLVAGPPGNGKSYAYEHALRETPYHLFRARRTPIKVYNELHDNPDWPIVFDDISALLRDDNFLDLLKSLCETTKTKTIRWGTTTPKLEGRAASFRCTSRVLIVMNEMPTNRAEARAVLDRCDAVHFVPKKNAVIARMRCAFPNDTALIDLLEELPVLPSLRTLIKARQWQHSKHLDVVEELVSECGLPDAVNTLIQIMTLHPEREWCQQYVAETGLTERTYRRHKQISAQIVDCWAIQDRCPNVRPGTRVALPMPNPEDRAQHPSLGSTNGALKALGYSGSELSTDVPTTDRSGVPRHQRNV